MGNLWAWGDNTWAQLGLGRYGNDVEATPQQVKFFKQHELHVGHATCGPGVSIVVTSANAVFGWGDNRCGQLNSTATARASSINHAMTSGSGDAANSLVVQFPTRLHLHNVASPPTPPAPSSGVGVVATDHTGTGRRHDHDPIMPETKEGSEGLDSTTQRLLAVVGQDHAMSWLSSPSVVDSAWKGLCARCQHYSGDMRVLHRSVVCGPRSLLLLQPPCVVIVTTTTEKNMTAGRTFR